MVIERVINSRDGRRRVNIVRRPNGTFGFVSFQWLEPEGIWAPEGRYSECIVETADEAEAEARSRIAWLSAAGADV